MQVLLSMQVIQAALAHSLTSKENYNIFAEITPGTKTMRKQKLT